MKLDRIAIVVIVLGQSCGTKSEFQKVLDSPEEFHSREITLDGILHYQLENIALYKTCNGESDEAIWADFSGGTWIYNYTQDQLHNHRVRLKGKFDKNLKGHMDAYAGTLKDATIVTLGDIDSVGCIQIIPPNEIKLASLQFLRENHLGIRTLSLDGFELHFNCDSVPFLKRSIGDTTRIWTASTTSLYEVHKITEKINPEKFGRTQYINSVGEDGRIELVNMHETVFIKRNDSLYQTSRFIKPKLIFHPRMFSDGRQSVRLNEKYNYERDSIVLGRSWIENNLKHYYIIVANRQNGENTAYSFTFDENLKFIYWENCKQWSN